MYLKPKTKHKFMHFFKKNFDVSRHKFLNFYLNKYINGNKEIRTSLRPKKLLDIYPRKLFPCSCENKNVNKHANKQISDRQNYK